MATEYTANFQLPKPTNQELLSDGAKAIRDLADAIDAAQTTLKQLVTQQGSSLTQTEASLRSSISNEAAASQYRDAITDKRLLDNNWWSLRGGSAVTNHLGFAQFIVPFGFTWAQPPIVVCSNGHMEAVGGYAAVYSPSLVTRTQFQAIVHDYGRDGVTGMGVPARINWIAFGVA